MWRTADNRERVRRPRRRFGYGTRGNVPKAVQEDCPDGWPYRSARFTASRQRGGPCRRRRTGAYGTERKSDSGNQGTPEHRGHRPALCGPETQRPPLGGPVPFSSGNQTVVFHQRGRRFLLLFRLSGVRGPVRLLRTDQRAGLPGDAGAARRRGRGHAGARAAEIRRPARRADHVQTAATAQNP